MSTHLITDLDLSFCDGQIVLNRAEVKSLHKRRLVEVGDQEAAMELLQSTGAHDTLVFRDGQLLLDDAFMLSMTSAYYLKGTQWVFMIVDVENSKKHQVLEAIEKWLPGGGWASRSLLEGKEEPSLDETILLAIAELLGVGVGRERVQMFDGHAFRYRNQYGEPETRPGRLDASTGPAYLIPLSSPPEWPYRIAYHGAGTMEAFEAIRTDGWRLKACFKRCYHGPGIYLSPSFIVAMRHYGSQWESADGRLFSLCFQVAVRDAAVKAPTYGFTRYDPQWHDCGGVSPLGPSFHNAAPELLVPEGPEQSQILALVLLECLDRPPKEAKMKL